MRLCTHTKEQLDKDSGCYMDFIDFCAGIGGFRLGMELAGHKCIGFCENDKFAIQSYKAMFDTEGEWFRDDITKLKSNEIPYADCWTFGFPCQDISIAGKQKGIVGQRSNIYFTIINLIKSKKEEDKPRILLIENVKNLLSINNGWDFLRVLSEMDNAGYDAEWQVLNSKNFGVPQNRERVFIIGNLRSRGRREILPITRENTATIKQIIGGAQGERIYSTNGISSTLCGNSGGLGAKTGLYFIDYTLDNPKLTTECRCLIAKYNAGITKMNNNSGVIDNTYRVRRLTPKECFRLQGFPDEYFERARKVNSDNQLYRQIGNAVTVNVVYEIAKKLKEGEIDGTS